VQVIEDQRDGSFASEVVEHGGHRVEEREPSRGVVANVRSAVQQGTCTLASPAPRLGWVLRGGGAKNL
jgi:hypothetical protein